MNALVEAPPLHFTLTQSVDRASAMLYRARSAAEVLEAKDLAMETYVRAKNQRIKHRLRKASTDLIDAMSEVMAEALLIKSNAEIRIADEYDAAQANGDVAKAGHPSAIIPDGNNKPATAAEVGLTAKVVHHARRVRDAEKASPGLIKRTLDKAVEQKRAPSRKIITDAIADTIGLSVLPAEASRRAPKKPTTTRDREIATVKFIGEIRALKDMWIKTRVPARRAFLRDLGFSQTADKERVEAAAHNIFGPARRGREERPQLAPIRHALIDGEADQ